MFQAIFRHSAFLGRIRAKYKKHLTVLARAVILIIDRAGARPLRMSAGAWDWSSRKQPCQFNNERVVCEVDVAAITQFISNVGFPIACVIMLWFKMNEDSKAHKAEMDKMTEALNNNTLAVQHMSDMLAATKGNK